AAKILDGVVYVTPVLRSSFLDDQCGGTVFLKCENLQRTGAFKFRGAYHALVRKETTAPFHQVVTVSSGNHAQGLALASQLLGYSAHIVMPEPVNVLKRRRVEELGATVTVQPTRQEAQEFAQDLVWRKRGLFIHPFNDADVIAGQGTATWELLQAESALDAIVAPVGGGGLLAGACLAAHGVNPAMKAYGCEPARALDVRQSLQHGYVVQPDPADTIAEGLRTSLGELTFGIVRDHVEDIFVVEEEEIVAAMKVVFERLHLVLEPSAAVALVPILRGEPALANKAVGVLLSGGNISLPGFFSLIDQNF
ncbi:MAG: threonine/serine dehydratase, partial [Nitrospirota bacterium]|nr:threonine/serine dehydratase [Nitrospirota bacterium]